MIACDEAMGWPDAILMSVLAVCVFSCLALIVWRATQ